MTDIAIIGMAGYFPEAENTETFYRNLRSGRDSVRELPFSRRLDTSLPIDRRYRKAGYLENIHFFDHEFFGISLGEAQQMDPRQRLLMQVAVQALEDAGFNTDDLNGSLTAVYIVSNEPDYYRLATRFDPTLITGNMQSATAGKIARFFNFRGKAMFLDSACSSSLLAVHEACCDLLNGECEMAVVAGISIDIFPLTYDQHAAAGILSPDDKAKTFSAAANGTAQGESAGCIILRTLPAAMANGDIIHAVIKATAVNQDAALSGNFTSPSSQAQSEVIFSAWAKAGIDPLTIRYIEAHGTGTKLGDPTELQGLRLAFGKTTDEKGFCAISALKTNIGHTDRMSGLAGLIKTVLSIKHKMLFPSLHFDAPNPFIDFSDSPVYVVDKLLPWKNLPGMPRRAGVSSFSLMGTNVHAVLEEYPTGSDADKDETDRPFFFLFSARTKESLNSYIDAMIDHLDRNPALSPFDVSYTLAIGRKHHTVRAGVIASTTTGLLEALKNTRPALLIQAFRASRIVIVFSHRTSLSPDWTDRLCRDYPFFALKLAEAQDGLKEAADKDLAAVLGFQLAYYQLLASEGIETNILLGDGIGKLTIDKITGNKDWRTIAAALSGFRPVSDPELPGKVQHLAVEQAGYGALFLEAGPEGDLSRLLIEQAATGKDIAVVVLPDEPEPVTITRTMVALFRHQIKPNWSRFTGFRNARRVELPAYQFKKNPVWLRKPAFSSLSEWLYKPEWREHPLDNTAPDVNGRHFLLFLDDLGIGERLAALLVGQGAHVVRSARKTTVEEYETLFIDLRGMPVSDVIDLSRLRPDTTGMDDIDRALDTELLAAFNFFKVFDPLLQTGIRNYWACTVEAFRILGHEREHNPVAAALHGMLNSVAHEYPRLGLACFDLDRQLLTKEPSVAAGIIFRELSAQNKVSVGLRNQQKYFISFKRSEAMPFKPASPEKERSEGVYLITGGTSGLGLEIFKKWSREKAGTFILLGKGKHVPGMAPIEKQDLVIGDIPESTKYCAYEVDISDYTALSKVLTNVRAAYGPIGGVIHAAGVPGKKRLRSHTVGSFSEALAPKINGTVNLMHLLRDDLPDFFVSFSSQTAFLGEDKFSNYSAANSFLFHSASYLRNRGIPAKVISWPAWRETGMWHRANRFTNTDLDDGFNLSTEEGLNMLEMILRLEENDWLVCKVDPSRMGSNPFFETSAGYETTDTVRPVSDKPAEEERQLQPPAYKQVDPTWTILQQTIAAIWVEILKPDRLTLADDFFDIGGHSLNGTQVINLIEKQLGLQMEFDEMFEHPTLGELCAHVDKRLSERSARTSRAIPRAAESEYYDLSYSQKRIWLSCQVPGLQLYYMIIVSYVIEGALHREILQKAVLSVVDRHEILRTTYHMVDGVPRQRVRPAEDVNFKIVVSAAGDSGGTEQLVDQIVGEELYRDMNIETGPILIVRLVSLDADTHLLLFNLHHIAGDAWSVEIMIRDLLSYYNAFLNGEKDPLPPALLQYKDFADWQNKRFSGDGMAAHKDFWIHHIEGHIKTVMPTDFARPPVPSFKGGTKISVMEKELTTAVRDLIRTQDVTLFMTLQTFVNILVHKYTQQRQLITGLTVSGREHADLSEMLGFFINIIPLNVFLDPEESFSAVLKRTGDIMRSLYPHQSYPFDQILESVGKTEVSGDNRLFNIVTNLLEANNTQYSLPAVQGLKISEQQRKRVRSIYDLLFQFVDMGDTINFGLEYSSDLYEQATISLFQEQFCNIARQCCDDPFRKISTISLNIHRPDSKHHLAESGLLDW